MGFHVPVDRHPRHPFLSLPPPSALDLLRRPALPQPGLYRPPHFFPRQLPRTARFPSPILRSPLRLSRQVDSVFLPIPSQLPPDRRSGPPQFFPDPPALHPLRPSYRYLFPLRPANLLVATRHLQLLSLCFFVETLEGCGMPLAVALLLCSYILGKIRRHFSNRWKLFRRWPDTAGPAASP